MDKVAMTAASDVVPAWQVAVHETVSQFRFGDTITKAWLAERFKIDMPDIGTPKEIERANLRFFASMDLYKRELLHEHCMALCSLGRGEWQIVQPGLQHSYAVEHAREGMTRAVRQARELIEHTRTDLLNAEEARARNDAAGKLASLEQLMTRRFKKIDMPSLSLPKVPDPTSGLGDVE